MLIQEKASDDGLASLPWMEFYSCCRRRQPAMFARRLNIKDHIHPCLTIRKQSINRNFPLKLIIYHKGPLITRNIIAIMEQSVTFRF